MPDTVQTALDKGNPNDMPARFKQVLIGTVLAAMANFRPRVTNRTGLTSSATQVHGTASLILHVETPVGTPLAMITGGSPGAGEVSVDYDATTGIPTLTFNAAVTAYSVNETGDLTALFSTLQTALAVAV